VHRKKGVRKRNFCPAWALLDCEAAMSARVMAKVWDMRMPPAPKAVLLSLSDEADDHGRCWLSIARLCRRTCFEDSDVRTAIGWLEGAGVLRVQGGLLRRRIHIE
jgi:hypothetical protein